MKNRLILLSIILAFNAALFLTVNADEDYKICKGFEPGPVLSIGSGNVSVDTDGVGVFGFNWDLIECCKTSTEMAWCDFQMEDAACRKIVKRDANPFCLVGMSGDESDSDWDQSGDDQ